MSKLSALMSEVREAGGEVMLNLGMGVDSTAMLVGMKRLGLKPDRIMFADTGGEKPETYAYIWELSPWLEANGFPGITIVWREPAKVTYKTLEENCIANETLPSLAFGRKSCSLKWKGEPMDRYLIGVKRGPNKCAPALEPQCVPGKSYKDKDGKRRRHSPEVKAMKLIGYDSGPADSRRSVGKNEDDCFRYYYPLREWGWTREDCVKAINEEGLKQPVKSACFYCPASKPWEVMWLAAKHPEQFLRAINMEDNARAGKHGLGNVKGLWRKKSWREWAEEQEILWGHIIIMSPEELLEKAEAMKPAYEANDCSSGCGEDLVQLKAS